nr:MAG TPA: hypothetical protein [Caudoviricetes sp.]DAU59322.1 MAG TPA: hypothetical protein [Crassvirales sp.]
MLFYSIFYNIILIILFRTYSITISSLIILY